MSRKHEVLEQFCTIRGLVRLHTWGAADCLCGETSEDPYGWQDDGKVMEFIEDAVLAKWAEVSECTFDEAKLRLAQFRGDA